MKDTDTGAIESPGCDSRNRQILIQRRLYGDRRRGETCHAGKIDRPGEEVSLRSNRKGAVDRLQLLERQVADVRAKQMRSVAPHRITGKEHVCGSAVLSKKLNGQARFLAPDAVEVRHRGYAIERQDFETRRDGGRFEKEAIKRVWRAISAGGVLGGRAGSRGRCMCQPGRLSACSRPADYKCRRRQQSAPQRRWRRSPECRFLPPRAWARWRRRRCRRQADRPSARPSPPRSTCRRGR